MNVVRLSSLRRLPGCGERCFGNRHDPFAHEAYGLMLGIGPNIHHRIQVGPLDIDLVRRTVTVDGRPIWLSMRELGVLTHMARRVGHWCDVGDILADAWGEDYRANGIHAFRVRLSCLRKKLGPAGRLIVTGYPHHSPQSYRLVAEVPS